MQLTKFSDYSLRVLMFLALRQGVPATIRQISAAHRISENHLKKVVHHLSKRGYLKTTRGKGGGIVLARSPQEILLGNLLRDVEPFQLVECFEPGYDGACDLFPACRLRRALQTAQSQFLATLNGYRVGDLVSSRQVKSG